MMNKFHNEMLAEAHFNRDLMRKNLLLAPGFKPITF